MTIEEMNSATLANANFVEVPGFTKAFRTDELTNIVEGEEFEIPTNYKVISQRIMRGGQPVVDSEGKPLTAEFINVIATHQGRGTKRNVRFYPSSLCKTAFAVDENGHDLQGSERIVRSSGPLYEFVKGRPINDVMQSLRGCTIKCTAMKEVRVRAFGVPSEKATAKDVQKNNVGTWDIVGEKKPAGWS